MSLKRGLKAFTIGGLLVAGSVGVPGWSPDLHAAMPVVDISNLQQNTLTAVRTAQQIQNQIEQIRNQVRTLQTFSASSYSPLTTIYASNMRELDGLLADVQGIGFDLSRIDAQFNELFPEGQWSQVDQSRYRDYYEDWNRELTEAARLSMKSQSAIQRSQAYNNEAAAILSRSAGADGEVRQLQATNQMLGVMAGQMDGLTQTLAFNARVSATAAASAAQKEEAERAFSRQMWNGYGNADAKATPKYTNMPSLKH
jgi:P-type conjugative transfer protein TrbJ